MDYIKGMERYFTNYGHWVYIEGLAEVFVREAEDFALIVRGEEKILDIDKILRGKR